MSSTESAAAAAAPCSAAATADGAPVLAAAASSASDTDNTDDEDDSDEFDPDQAEDEDDDYLFEDTDDDVGEVGGGGGGEEAPMPDSLKRFQEKEQAAFASSHPDPHDHRLVRVPAAAATLRQLVALLGAHEPDLTDLLLGLCKPWHVAAHKRELPPHPAGPLGTYAVTIPAGTTKIARESFLYLTSLTEIALPPTPTEIRGESFMGCTSLAEITLPPILTEIGQGGLLGLHVLGRDHAAASAC